MPEVSWALDLDGKKYNLYFVRITDICHFCHYEYTPQTQQNMSPREIAS